MWNILKATLHQTKRDRISYGMLVFMLLISFCGMFMCFMDPDTPFSGVTGSFSFIQCGMLFGSEFLALCCALVAGRIAGWDLRDQTANYEVLFGKKRSAVYFGRLLAVLLIGLISIPLILPIGTLFCTVCNGWGASFTVQNALLHTALAIPVTFRLLCFFTALTFITGNEIVTFVSTFFICMTTMLFKVLGEMLRLWTPPSWLTASLNLADLLMIDNSTTELINGRHVDVYKHVLTSQFVAETIISSVLFGILWIALGYLFFRKKDLR